MKSHDCRSPIIILVGIVVSAVLSAHAQPSGGPYGPIHQTYTVPKNAAHVFYVAPEGKAENAGRTLDDPTSLDAAIASAVTDDVIVFRGGTYRTGGLVVNQGVTLQPFADERPIIKGTMIATNWEGLRDNVWRTTWPTLFPQKPADWWRREREGMRTPQHKFNNDMVFFDGRFLQSAGWEGELNTNNFSIDYDHTNVFVGQNPTNHVVEITAFDSALIRTTRDVHGKKSDGKGLTIRGITFTQYAYRALEIEGHEPDRLADPSTFGKDVVGSTFENMTISYCSRVAGYFRGDHMIFRNCRISDTSTEGIYIIASSDCLLERNIFARNNIEHITGYFPSAVKIFNQTRRVVCRDNVVIDQPESNGIWYDVGNHDGVFVNNWVEGCQDGFFYEISRNVICAGNVFFNCSDAGIRILNSAGARVYHNTFIDATASFERTERSAVGDHFGWHPSTGPGVEERDGHEFVGNLLTSTEGFAKPLLQFYQTNILCGTLTRPQVAKFDENVYVRAGDSGRQNLLLWSPVVGGTNCLTNYRTLQEFRKVQPEFETRGVDLANYYGSPFDGPSVKNYALDPGFKPLETSPLPPEIQKLLNWTRRSEDLPGAYPGKR